MSQTPKIAGFFETSEATSPLRLRSGSRPLSASDSRSFALLRISAAGFRFAHAR
jgi:hypothetical protein